MSTDKILAIIILLPGFLFLVSIVVVILFDVNESKTKGKKLRASEEFFNNRLFVCRDDGCEVKFFRVYQAIEGIEERSRFSFIGRYNDAELFEKYGVCPGCLSEEIEEVKREFDWMKSAVGFLWLDSKSLAARRKAFVNDREMLSERISEVELLIEEKESVESFQWHYELDSTMAETREHLEVDILLIKTDITKQLEKFKGMTRHVILHNRIDSLVRRLNVTPEEVYGKKLPVVEEEPEEQVQREVPEPVRKYRRFSLFNIVIRY